MVFGRRPRGVWGPTGRRGLAFTAALALLVSAGCGGGGGGDDDGGGGGGGGGGQQASISGRVLDRSNGDAAVAGAVVTYGPANGPAVAQTTTGADGRFILSFGVPRPALVLKIVGPSQNGVPAYYNSGYYQGRLVRLGTDGIPIGAITTAQAFSVGDILLFSSEGPPPPPTI
jgi:hypothetical protein